MGENEGDKVGKEEGEEEDGPHEQGASEEEVEPAPELKGEEETRGGMEPSEGCGPLLE